MNKKILSRQRWRKTFWLGTLVSLALLASCGGESNGAGGNATTTAAVNPQLLDVSQPQGVAQASGDNRIIKNNDAAVSLAGQFSALDGYLQKSGNTLVGSDAGRSAATFTLPVSRPGYYEVFVWWPQAAPAKSAVRVEVQHATGRAAQTFDQTGLGGQWNSVGTFAFKPSQLASVMLSSVAGSPLLVDAVRLQYLGADRPDIALRGDELPIGETGVDYRGRVPVTGGTAPYTFRLAAGALPQGLSLDSGSGEISGVPSEPGKHELQLQISDASDRSETVRMKLVIVKPSVAKPAPPRPLDFNRRESRADGSPSGAWPDLSALHSVVAAMPPGSWSKVNLNDYSSAWTPPELRPLYGWSNPAPDRILLAWSSAAWDPNRGQLILYGGGHANYRGNDVYIWKGATQRWERGSLPSEMVQEDSGAINPIDGAGHAPSSAHTYDNAVFLPVLDRFLTLGGAADPGGGAYYTTTPEGGQRPTGPYLFDPSRADPNKVGGTTGSHVKREGPYPEVVGGNMWQNRENYLNALPPPSVYAFVNGCTGYAQENGKDVVYVRQGVYHLYRYTIPSLTDTTQDKWEMVGLYWGGPGAKATCAVDPVTKVFLRTAENSLPFVYWDLNTAGPNNHDVKMTPVDPGGQFTAYMAGGTRNLADCGLEFDPKRGQFALWCGDGRVWTLKPPAVLSPNGWVISQQPAPAGAVPNGDVGTGILGKWKYISNLDVFLGVQDIVQGNIWLYKPVGWQDPGPGGGGGGSSSNVPPSVSLVQPAAGASVASGSAVTLAANAGDSDGSVSKVAFYAGALKVGEATAAPYQVSWTAGAAGSVSLTAVATDNAGAQTTSAAVSITVTSGGGGGGGGTSTTVVLQRGQGGYLKSSDTFLSTYHQGLAWGSAAFMRDYASDYSVLTRFAIFASEGGPVPDGATIESATVSLYKSSPYDMTYGLHRLLKNWQEGSANWIAGTPGANWSVGGANGAGSDYTATADATSQTGFNPGWLAFNVTASVQQMSGNPSTNYGWKLRGTGGYISGNKSFYSSEYPDDATLRPKMEIRYR